MLKGQRGLERWEGGGEKERGRRKGSKIKREKCERKGGGGRKDTKYTK
jgi:hypothetical protein